MAFAAQTAPPRHRVPAPGSLASRAGDQHLDEGGDPGPVRRDRAATGIGQSCATACSDITLAPPFAAARARADSGGWSLRRNSRRGDRVERLDLLDRVADQGTPAIASSSEKSD